MVILPTTSLTQDAASAVEETGFEVFAAALEWESIAGTARALDTRFGVLAAESGEAVSYEQFQTAVCSP